MAHNKLYRNFIILQGDEKNGNALGDKAMSGYAKIEAKSDKCKISFYAQNLKKEDSYSIVLICYKKDLKQIVDLGSLDVTDLGKGECGKEYYVNDIAGLGFSYEKISGAAVCKYVDGKLEFLMYGFMSNEGISDSWKKCKVVKSTEKVIKEDKKIKEEVKKEIKKEEHKEEHDKCKKDEKKKEDCNECVKEEKKKEKDCEEKESHKHNHDKEHECHCEENCKDEHIDKCKEDKKKEEEKKDKKKEEEKKKEVKDCNDACGKRDDIDFDEYETRINDEIDPYSFEMRGALGEFFEGIVKDFEEVKNKFKEIKYCKWYKVKVNDLDEMCNVTNYNKYTIAYYPMLNYYPYIKKYGYFLLGYKCDNKGELKYIVYGVPGKKDKDEQPYVGKTGFVTWMDIGKGNVGCWLMFYDYKNSTVVVPMK